MATSAHLQRQADERTEVRAWIKALLARGYSLTRADDGEENHKVATIKEAMDVVFSVDESRLRFRRVRVSDDPTQPDDRCSLYIVLGNSGPEAICDMGYSTPDAEADINAVAEERERYWERRGHAMYRA